MLNWLRNRNPIIIIGAGGHALSVVDSAEAADLEIAGFVDEHKEGSWAGYPILGKSIDDIENPKAFRYHIAIGDCLDRYEWYNILRSRDLYLANIIDPTAIVSDNSDMGVGNYIGKLAVIVSGSIIGNNNIINTKALVEHGCSVWSHSNISTNATLNGDVCVENCVLVGSGATCNGQLTIGHNSKVGSGAVVTKNVLPNSIVVGIPARAVVTKED